MLKDRTSHFVFAFLLVLVMGTVSFASLSANQRQSSSGTWSETINLSNSYANELKKTADGGYVVVMGAVINSYDTVVIKLDQAGQSQWKKAFGGLSHDYGFDVIETYDGNFIIAGATLSYGTGGRSAWVFKLDAGGDLLWDRVFTSLDTDESPTVLETSTGNYVLVGHTRGVNPLKWDLFLVGLDQDGSKLFEKTIGTTDENEFGHAAVITSNDEIVIATGGAGDLVVIKTDVLGNIVWHREYAASSSGIIYGLTELNSGYAFVGESNIAGDYDLFVARLTDEGDIIWGNRYGTVNSADHGYDIAADSNDDLFVVGSTKPTGEFDSSVLLKLDANGSILWQKSMGGSMRDVFNSVIYDEQGSTITVAGETASFGGSGRKAWISNLDSLGNLDTCNLELPINFIVQDAGLIESPKTLIEQNPNFSESSPGEIGDVLNITPEYLCEPPTPTPTPTLPMCSVDLQVVNNPENVTLSYIISNTLGLVTWENTVVIQGSTAKIFNKDLPNFNGTVGPIIIQLDNLGSVLLTTSLSTATGGVQCFDTELINTDE